nr:hypothetical protein [Tanacetum cinerariifolium]
MHSEGQDSPLTKLTNIVKGTYKFGMKIPDTMINHAFKKLVGYKYFKAKKAESNKAKSDEKPEEQHVSPIISEKGKCNIRSDDQEENVPSAFKKNAVPRKTKTLTVADNIFKELFAVELAKSSVLKNNDINNAKQAVRGEGSSAAHNKYYEFENISASDSDATQDSSRSDTDEERDDETDDFGNSDIDLCEDKPKGDDDVAGFRVFMYNKST